MKATEGQQFVRSSDIDVGGTPSCRLANANVAVVCQALLLDSPRKSHTNVIYYGHEMVCSKISAYTPLKVVMPKKPANTESPANFEEAMAELQQLVAKMEAGELALEASITAYKRGADLVKYCLAQLDMVDSQVKILEGDMLKPFAADAGEAEA